MRKNSCRDYKNKCAVTIRVRVIQNKDILGLSRYIIFNLSLYYMSYEMLILLVDVTWTVFCLLVHL